MAQAIPDEDKPGIAAKYGWDESMLRGEGPARMDAKVREVPIAAIRRPLPTSNNPEKVEILMRSIDEIGLQDPIDVLEVDGLIYGFSGCHRFEAHQRLGREAILCRVRKATPQVLKLHLG